MLCPRRKEDDHKKIKQIAWCAATIGECLFYRISAKACKQG